MFDLTLKGENHPRFGKHHSEESKRKISESMKGNTNNRGKHWKCKPRKSKDASEQVLN